MTKPQGLSYRKVFTAFVQSAPESYERRNALASLENISRKINQRYSDQWERGACPLFKEEKL